MVTGFLGLLLLATGAVVAWRSIAAVLDPAPRGIGWAAFVIALAAVFSKEALCRWTLSRGAELRSPALVANALHHRSDALSSIPVAVALLGAKLSPSLSFLDGLGGAVVSVFIMRSGLSVLSPALWELADSSAPEEIREEIRALAMSVEGVQEVHDLRTRLQGEGVQTDMHVVVDRDLTVGQAFGLIREVEERVRQMGPGVVDVMVRLEPDGWAGEGGDPDFLTGRGRPSRRCGRRCPLAMAVWHGGPPPRPGRKPV